jgi:hypothetical protein
MGLYFPTMGLEPLRKVIGIELVDLHSIWHDSWNNEVIFEEVTIYCPRIYPKPIEQERADGSPQYIAMLFSNEFVPILVVVVVTGAQSLEISFAVKA